MIRIAMITIVVSVTGAAWAQAPTPAPKISGVIVGTDKKPVAGAKVYVARLEETYPELRVFSPVATGDDGRFAVEGMPGAGGAVVEEATMVYVDAPGYPLARAVVYPGKPNEVVLGVGGGTVRGTVVDGNGKPVAGAVMNVRAFIPDAEKRETFVSVPAGLRERFQTKTDATGAWEVRDLPAQGTAYVTLDDPRYVATSRMMPCTPEGAAESPGTAKPDPLVARPASAITGRVTLPDGKPAANVAVAVRGTGDGDGVYGSVKTNADGAFRVASIAKGSFTLTVASPDKTLLAPARSGIAVVEGKETALDPIALITGTPVSGTVLDAETGAGIAGIAVDTGEGWSNRAKTDKDGAFLTYVLPGEITFQFQSRTSEYTNLGRIVRQGVKGGTPVRLEPVRLQPAPTVRLTVADEAGKPVTNLRLGVVPTEWTNDVVAQGYMGALTDEAGVWDSKRQYEPALEGRDAEYQIQVVDDWEVVSPKSFKPSTDNKSLAVMLRRIDRSKRGIGRVTTPDGAPLAGVQVSIFSGRIDESGNQQDRKSVSVSTDKKGEYLLPALKPGNHVGVSASLDDHRGASGEGTAATENAPARVPDLVLTPLNGAIRGVVLRDKTPVAGAQVWSPDGDRRTWTRTDAKGAFVLKRVPGKGGVTITASLGKAVANATFAAGEKASLLLAPVATPLLFGRVPLPPAAAKAQAVRDRARAMELIAQLAGEAAPGAGVRDGRWGQDVLANLLSPVDFEAAMQVARGADGKITDQALSGLIERRIAVDVEGAETVFQKRLPEFTDPTPIVYLSCSLGMAYSAKQPAKALAYYRLAAKTLWEKKQDDTYAAQRLAVLAYRLNLPDAEVEPVLELATGGKDKVPGEWLVIALAEGDGVRAAKRVERLPKERRIDTLYRIVEAMAPHQPIEARKLLDSITEPATEEVWSRGRAIVNIVEATVAFDPEAAYRLALTASSVYRSEALAHAAGGIRHDSALRAKRFAEAAKTTEEYTQTYVLLTVATIAEESAPAVAATLRKQAREAIASESDSIGGGATIARVLLPEVPELCRRVIELSMNEQRRNNPGHASDYDMLRRDLRVLALIDPDRALQIAGGLKQKGATFRMKADLALLLLTPPHKRLASLAEYP